MIGKWTRIFSCCVSLSITTPVIAEALLAKEWHGELFGEKEGALFFKTNLSPFKGEGFASSGVVVTLYNVILRTPVTITNLPSALDEHPRQVWRIRSGKYRIERVEFVERSGVKRVWNRTPEQSVMVIVPRVSLANLGLWTLSPVGSSGMSVKFDVYRNTYKEQSHNKDSSVSVVVNGFTGVVQETLAGKAALDAADSQHSGRQNLRVARTVTRKLSVNYKLDLINDNAHAKTAIGALHAFDDKFRQCYENALEDRPSLHGSMVFKVLISSRSGTMKQLRRSSGTIGDGALTDCIIKEVQQVPLPIRKNMLGELTFSFEVQS